MASSYAAAVAAGEAVVLTTAEPPAREASVARMSAAAKALQHITSAASASMLPLQFAANSDEAAKLSMASASRNQALP